MPAIRAQLSSGVGIDDLPAEDVRVALEPSDTVSRELSETLPANVRVLLSLGHNMAQPNGMTAAMIDVLTEDVHNSSIPSAEGQKRLVAAVESAK